MTSLEVAKMLGFSADHVRRLILQGKIKAQKLGHNWIVDPKDIIHIKRQRLSKKAKKE